MIAEILSIGDELTCGKILDTNSQWLARELSDLGIRGLYHTTVGDDLDATIAVLRIATQRADVIIATGGLGPTADDLTRESIAALLGVPLEQNADALESIKALFRKRGREMTSNNEKQAFIPQGGKAIRNPNGTAPGVDVTVARKNSHENLMSHYRIIALPGVPAEMKEMWHETVRGELEAFCRKMTGRNVVIRSRSIHSFGAGESQVETMLPDIVNRTRFPLVGITADRATITLRIQAEAPTEEECFEQMEPTAKLIYDKLGPLIYGEADQTLADVVCEILQQQKKTIAVMEWGTRGLLDDALASSPLALEAFLGGLIVRSAAALKNAIRFSSELAEKQEIPHDFSETTPEQNEQVVALMCRHALKMFNADYSLAIGPYPDSGKNGVPVFIALGISEQNGTTRVITESHPYGGHPALIDDLYMKRTLNLFRLKS
ncbi:MAG: CinA family nicotinamide mononucleotide deamidase-related protein [Planctomycetaceae bacterium]|nr:CinA family nicotinamide mononucleotide deamidase-related protein [Planctomycetaceae bacterium]